MAPKTKSGDALMPPYCLYAESASRLTEAEGDAAPLLSRHGSAKR